MSVIGSRPVGSSMVSFAEERGWARGHNPQVPKSPNNVTSTFFNTVNLLPKDLGSNMGTTNLLLAPGAIQPRYVPDRTVVTGTD